MVDSGHFWCYYKFTKLIKGKVMFFLTGEYNHQIDAKNRIRIPTKLKGNEESLYFSKGTNNCLFVFTVAEVQEKFAALYDVKLNDVDKQKGLRAFTKSFQLVESDGQGRMIIPSALKQFAKIEKDIVICGAGSHIEIWAKEVYDEYFKDEDVDFDTLFNTLDI